MSVFFTRLFKSFKSQFAHVQELTLPAKTFIGQVEKGIDFLSFHCCSSGMQVSEQTLSWRDNKLTRIYEQGASKQRIGKYLVLCFGWALLSLGPTSLVQAYGLCGNFYGYISACVDGHPYGNDYVSYTDCQTTVTGDVYGMINLQPCTQHPCTDPNEEIGARYVSLMFASNDIVSIAPNPIQVLNDVTTAAAGEFGIAIFDEDPMKCDATNTPPGPNKHKLNDLGITHICQYVSDGKVDVYTYAYATGEYLIPGPEERNYYVGKGGATLYKPGSPTGISGVADNMTAELSFSAHSDTGGLPLLDFTASCGGGTPATGAVSPLTVTGLTNGTTYNCSVTARNAKGSSLASSQVSVTPVDAPKGVSGVLLLLLL